jgi:hypothetical protein
MKLRKFTEEGHRKYIILYDTIKESINKNNKDIEKGFSKKLQEEIKNLKNNHSLSTEVPLGKNLKEQNFKTSYELGAYLDNLLKDCNLSEISFDEKLWDWITLFHFDTVFSTLMTGYSEHRYVLSNDWKTRYRHLVRSSWFAYNKYQNSSKLFLSKAPYVGTDFLEQFISHRITENYTPSAECVYELYYDKKNQKTRPGYSKKFIKKKGVKTLVKASMGRFIDKLNQYNQIYDIWLMEPKDIISLLPKEFDELKKLNGYK